MTESQNPPSVVSFIRHEFRPLAALAIWFVAVAIASGVWWNVPLIDDWTYAWSVERLLETGRFEVLDWTGNFVFGQVLWGAAWSRLLGFSFVALRVSTLALGLIACGGLYMMLRDFAVPRVVALIGALTLAVNPAFAVLAASFMSDVPFATCVTLSLVCYTRAAHFSRPPYLWWAGFWALAAFSVRHVGVIVPLAGAPLLFFGGQSRTLRPLTVAAALGITWSAMAVLWLTLDTLVGHTSTMTRWAEQLQQVVLISPYSYFAYNLDLLQVLSFFVLPALLLAAAGRNVWRSRALVVAAIICVVTMVAVFGELPLPLAPGETWNLREIGSSRALVGGQLPPQWPWIRLPVRLAGLLSFSLLVAPLLQSIGSRSLTAARRAIAGGSPVLCLLTFAVGYLGIVNLFWLYNDRYYLALMPPLITLILAPRRATRVTPRLAWVPIGVFAALALVGSRDAFRFNLAIRDSWETLINAGIAPSDIDAGYAWNGWMLYAHPEHLAAGMTPQSDVPWITSARQSKYMLAKALIDGYEVERAVVWNDLPWPGPDRLLVLRRQEGIGGK